MGFWAGQSPEKFTGSPAQKHLSPGAGLEQIGGLYSWLRKSPNSTVLLSSLSRAITHRKTSTDRLVTSELPQVPAQPWGRAAALPEEHSLEDIPIPSLIQLISEIRLCSLPDVSAAARNPLHEAAAALLLF